MLTPLYVLDPEAHVLYVGTLNKSMFVSLRLAYAVMPESLTEAIANVRTQLDGFTPPVRQAAMSRFMNEGLFSSHLRHMVAVYAAKRAALVSALAPLAAEGWNWSKNPAGIHLLLRHQRGDLARAVARTSALDLALLSSYRVARAPDDGVFLRYGTLDLETGAAVLTAAANRAQRVRGGSLLSH